MPSEPSQTPPSGPAPDLAAKTPLWTHRGSRTPPSNHSELPGRNAPTRLIAIRAYSVIALILIAMLAALLIAKHILLSDWSEKTRAARAAAAQRAAAAASIAAHAEAETETDSPDELRRQAATSWLYVDGRVDGPRVLRSLRRLGVRAGLPPSATWRALAAGLSPSKDRALTAAALRLAGDGPDTLNAWALRDMELGDYGSAIRRYDQLLRLHPGTPSALYNLALCHIYAHAPAEALHPLAAYLGQRPRDEAALRLLAAVLLQQGRAPLALDILETYIAAAAAPTPILLDAAYLEVRAGHDATAIRLLDAAIPVVPLARIIQVYNTPDFQRARLTAAGQALTARLASLARSAAAAPVLDDLLTPARPLQGAKRH